MSRDISARARDLRCRLLLITESKVTTRTNNLPPEPGLGTTAYGLILAVPDALLTGCCDGRRGQEPATMRHSQFYEEGLSCRNSGRSRLVICTHTFGQLLPFTDNQPTAVFSVSGHSDSAALPNRWISVTTSVWAVLQENPACLIRCVAMTR